MAASCLAALATGTVAAQSNSELIPPAFEEGAGPHAKLTAKLERAHWLARQTGVPPVSGYASWSQEARDVYVEIMDLIDDEFDNNRELRVQVLRAMAADVGTLTIPRVAPVSTFGESDSFLDTQYSLPRLSEPKELERAERLVRHLPEPNPALHAAVLRDIGDWRLGAADFEKAAKAYREAWQLLEDADDGRTLQLLLFDEPELLDSIRYRQPYGVRRIRDYAAALGIKSMSPGAPVARVELEFIVDESAQADDIRVISADPEWAASAGIRQVQSSLFRPRFDDGEFVAAPGRYIWSFRYDPVEAARRGLISSNSD